jgi:hypothetical protein
VAVGPEGDAPLEVFDVGGWTALTCPGLAVSNDPLIDVAVLALPRQLSRVLPLPADMDGLTWGQEVFFLGFPYGLHGEPAAMNEGRPFPFVVHAQHAGEFRDDHGNHVLVLDGQNNKGFSGGPIVFRRPGSMDYRIAGVIQSYWRRDEPVLDALDRETDYHVRANAGIVFGYPVTDAVALAQALASGAPVTRRE